MLVGTLLFKLKKGWIPNSLLQLDSLYRDAAPASLSSNKNENQLITCRFLVLFSLIFILICCKARHICPIRLVVEGLVRQMVLSPFGLG